MPSGIRNRGKLERNHQIKATFKQLFTVTSI